MKKIVADDIAGAFGLLRPYWQTVAASQIDGLVSQTQLMRPGLNERYGKVVGPRFIRLDMVGEFMARVEYAELRENGPLRWEFVFYKSRSDWIVIAVKWDDQFNELYVGGIAQVGKR